MKDEAPKSSPSRSPASEAESRVSPDTEQLAAQMSALLADLVRMPESDLSDWTPSLKVGDRLGRFTLVRELGRGGMGVVWEAEDPDLARRVALKVVRPGASARLRGQEWLRREAEAVARLSHPNIVTLFDFGLADSGPYLVFELLRGLPLDRRLRAGPLPYDSVLAIAVETCRALVHAHRAGVIHRDLKPANVYVSDGGDVKVLDFGLANLLGRTGPREGGTPAFMAPEQWRGELGDERTDLFALGVTLFAALTGRVPYAVKEGRSAVEEPGPTPQLPAGVAPPRFRRLVQRCLEREPAARPASSQAVLDELRALERALEGRARRRLFAGLTVAALGATLAAGWLWWNQEPPPGERLTTVVADAENRTGDPALDGLSGLLATSLEPSRRLLLVPRVRLLAMAREARLGDLARVEARQARDLARLASAQVLLLTSARREGSGIVVELKGLEPASDRPLFTVAESARSAEEVPGVLEQLAEKARRKLRERGEDLKAGRLSLSAALSPSLQATRAYFEGLDCLDRPGAALVLGPGSCTRHFDRALTLDPSFALAHFQLAVYAAYLMAREDGKAHIQVALRAVDRLPPHQAGMVRALAAQLDGRLDEAASGFDEVLTRWPDDQQALALASDLREQRDDWAGQVPYLERQLGLDPQAEAPLDPLALAYVRLGRAEELKTLVTRLEAQPLTDGRARVLVRAHQWLGDPAAAVAAARRLQGASPSPRSSGLLARALATTGSLAEAERHFRAAAEADPDEPYRWWALAGAVAQQGRVREARSILDRTRRLTERSGHASEAQFRAALTALLGDERQLWADTARAFSLDPEGSGTLVVALALQGDMAHAAELAARLDPATLAARELQALVAWRRGDAAGALATLAALERRNARPFTGGLEPALLVAEVSAAAGQPAETLAAVDRLRRLWPAHYSSFWGLPRGALLAARAHLALDQRAEARTELDRLLTTLRHADAELPLLREAKALRARL